MTKRHVELLKKNYIKGITTSCRAMEKRQERFLKAYIATGYNVSEACKKSGVTRHSITQWRKKYPEFANKMWEIEESITDFVESQMLKQIRNNNPAMIMWFLETKGKSRGYTRRFEMENNVKIELSTEQIDAMVRAHELAVKDDKGKLKMPLQLNTGKIENDTDDDNGDGPVDTGHRETGDGNEGRDTETTGSGDTGSEVSGSQ